MKINVGSRDWIWTLLLWATPQELLTFLRIYFRLCTNRSGLTLYNLHCSCLFKHSTSTIVRLKRSVVGLQYYLFATLHFDLSNLTLA